MRLPGAPALAVAVAVAGALSAPAGARAQALRLRGDALAATPSPVGLVVLEGEDRTRPWLTAEASIWWGGSSSGDDSAEEFDALSVSVKLRDPGGRGTLRLGRQVLFVGALHPTHADAALAQARLPARFTLESFAGLPVAPGFGPRADDWLAGARLARPLGPARLGLAWQQRRGAGALDDHELAADLAVVPDGPWDLGAALAWDLVDPGVSEARVGAALRRGAWRSELFALHRSPARLLPATSLFSVLGDVPSQRAGALVRWRAAPRLDLTASAGARRLDDDLGLDASLRARLRLDARGDGSVGLELRRDGGPDGAWAGARASARVPLTRGFGVAGELELVHAGDLWPWGLVALAWRGAGGWEAAAAVEAGASPSHVYRVDALVRVGRAWELAP